jgi:hypothetical protein
MVPLYCIGSFGFDLVGHVQSEPNRSETATILPHAGS